VDRIGNDDQDDTIFMGPPVPPVPPPPGGGRRWPPPRGVTFAGVAAIALAGGAGIGLASTHSSPAATASASVAAANPSPSATPVPAHGKPGRGWRAGGGPFRLGLGPAGILGQGGMVHGQFTIKKAGGGYETLDVQDGTVTAVSGTSLSVKSSDGYTATYAVTNSTLVDAQAKGIGSVKKGDTVFVTATGSANTAVSVTDITAVKAGRASFGFPASPPKPGAITPAPASPSGT
jgi:hypothetical protein